MITLVTKRTYDDLESAGRELAVALAKHGNSKSVVLAIANGAVPVALPVADTLDAHLDLIVIRRLFVREAGALPVSAISVCGQLVIDADPGNLSSIEEQYKQLAIDELSKRVSEMRGNTSSVDVEGLDVLLVDNGIHTGSTLQIAINALRKLRPRSVTVATPVANSSLKGSIESLADEVVCLQWCDHFGNTAVWYKKFDRPTDARIRTILQNRTPIRKDGNGFA